jgi:hypothetical protein
MDHIFSGQQKILIDNFSFIPIELEE